MYIDYQFIQRSIPVILQRLPITLLLAAVSFIIAFVFGTLFAYVNYKKVKVASKVIRVYMSIIRGTPIILQIYVIYNLTPKLLEAIFEGLRIPVNIYNIEPIWYAFFALSLAATVSASEAIRAGLESIEKGQFEAGLSVGLSEKRVLFEVVFPQAFTNAFPVLGNVLVDLIKSTSLAFMMSVIEITAQAKILGGEVLRYFEGYLCVFIIYIFLIKAVEIINSLIESRISTYKLGTAHR
jgi:His/Glu/Gln/Arg/opine family amino acid ABC transporter permease subunit